MEIVKYPNPILLTKSSPVELTQELKDFAFEMYRFMKMELNWGNVVGLAAPQVGKNIRLFWALDEWFLNPEILWMPKDGNLACKEGCYSLEENKFDYPVERAYAIKLRWQDLDGNTQEKRFNGFKAQVIQHEYDHLEGRLCSGTID